MHSEKNAAVKSQPSFITAKKFWPKWKFICCVLLQRKWMIQANKKVFFHVHSENFCASRWEFTVAFFSVWHKRLLQSFPEKLFHVTAVDPNIEMLARTDFYAPIGSSFKLDLSSIKVSSLTRNNKFRGEIFCNKTNKKLPLVLNAYSKYDGWIYCYVYSVSVYNSN